jgi:addiction module RelE/StbE family toxin
MRLRWTVPAAADLDSVKRYLDLHYPQRSESTIRSIYQRILQLKQFPRRGSEGRRVGTRELKLTPLPYVVVYMLRKEAVEILHIHHGSQDRS